MAQNAANPTAIATICIVVSDKVDTDIQNKGITEKTSPRTAPKKN
ncbi:hypothetical protein [Microseira wollei]|nr:hypothetical protein [Microseira wollei]